MLRVNAEWLRFTGLSREDVLGAPVAELLPEPREAALALLARARDGAHVEVPRHARRLDGRETWWEGDADPVPMEAGTGVLVTVREEPRSRAEALASDELIALRESEQRFRLLAGAMPQIVCVLAPHGVPEYVNPSWIAFSGLDLAATARLGWEGLVHPDDLPAMRECRRRR